MWFAAMTITLETTEQSATVDLQAAEYAHAAIMHCITAVDPALGRTIHDAKRHKPIAVAFVESAKQYALLRITSMGPHGLAATNALWTSLAATSSLQLGPTLWRITDICPAGTQWTGVSTWADLMVGSCSQKIDLRFVTPTAFTKRNSGGTRVMSLYPDAITLFTGLARRWDGLDGPPLPSNLDEYLLNRGCIESSVNIRTGTWDLINRKQKAFVGHVTYQCGHSDPGCSAALQQLARLASYSGVGYHTAQGMGAVSTLIGNQSGA